MFHDEFINLYEDIKLKVACKVLNIIKYFFGVPIDNEIICIETLNCSFVNSKIDKFMKLILKVVTRAFLVENCVETLRASTLRCPLVVKK